MNSIHIRDFRRADYPIDTQVAFGAGSFADTNGLVG